MVLPVGELGEGPPTKFNSRARVVLEKLLKMREGISCAVASKEAVESTNLAHRPWRGTCSRTPRARARGTTRARQLGRPFAAEGMLGDLVRGFNASYHSKEPVLFTFIDPHCNGNLNKYPFTRTQKSVPCVRVRSTGSRLNHPWPDL